MEYISKYDSPLGNITLAADKTGLTGLRFKGQKYYKDGLCLEYVNKETELLLQTKKWLDIYFKGIKPDFTIPVHLNGTEFQREVWEILMQIPYGKILSYGEIAQTIARRRGINRMSAQAAGNAIARNKISIIIPCHRVIAADGSLTGYAGGIDKKLRLLKLEKAI